jgi:hypothetical protein
MKIPEVFMYRKKEQSPSLEEAQAIVDGNVELLILHYKIANKSAQMLINEDGLGRDDLNLNPLATTLAKQNGYLVDSKGVKGNAIILMEKAKWT